MTLETEPVFPMKRDSPFCPAPMLRGLLVDNPVSRVTLVNGQKSWLVTRYADARSLLTSPDLSVDVRRPGYPRVNEGLARFNEGLLQHMDPPEHDVQRRMLAPEFMVKRIERLRPEVQRLVDGYLDEMENQGPPADLVEMLAFPLPARVICALLGVPFEDREFFASCGEAIVGPESSQESAVAASEELRVYLRKLVAEKDKDPGDDLISRVTTDYVRTGALSVAGLADLAQIILVAGFDTTGKMIALGVVTLLEHPEQLAELRRDPSLMPKAVEELLRYLTIVHWGRHRVATNDIVVGGQLIKAGEGIIIAQDIANRDATVFEDPDALDFHRQAPQHLTFGHGVHLCIGSALARLELQIAYTSIFERFPNLRLETAAADLDFEYGQGVLGVKRVPVSW
jgi:cytochrome P450